MQNVERPTSPHLSIYRKQITSVLSIMHRLTGIALYAGTFLMVAWLWVAAYSPAYYEQLYECMTSHIGKLLLLGWTVALYYHLANGIRHLYWDAGKGFAMPQVVRSGWAVILFTLVMTTMTWGFIQ